MHLRLLIFLLMFSLQSFGNEPINKSTSKTNIISGNVSDLVTGEVLSGVEVKLLEHNITVYTDFNGDFSFNVITTGKCTISFNYISYKKSVINEVRPGKRQIIKLRAESTPTNIRVFAENRDA